MKALLIHLTWPIVVVAACIFLYDRQVMRPALRVGVVDVGEVYRQKEAEFTLILTKAGTDVEREKAMVMARRFAQRLPIALDELPRECECMVVLKSAVAGDAARTVDLTASLRRKVETP